MTSALALLFALMAALFSLLSCSAKTSNIGVPEVDESLVNPDEVLVEYAADGTAVNGEFDADNSDIASIFGNSSSSKPEDFLFEEDAGDGEYVFNDATAQGRNGYDALSGGIDPFVDYGSSGINTEADFKTCLRRPQQFNIVFAIDNTGSQQTEDPTNIRGAGAANLVEELGRLLTPQSRTIINVATVSFFGDDASDSPAVTTTGQFFPIRPAGNHAIVQSFIEATTYPRGQTNYSRALGAAAQLFATKQSGKNFVVFLTDGVPTKYDYEKERKAVLTNLVRKHGAAIIYVLAGTSASNLYPRSDFMQDIAFQMTQPKKNPSDPKHLGKLIQARTASDLRAAWNEIFHLILRGCES